MSESLSFILSSPGQAEVTPLIMMPLMLHGGGAGASIGVRSPLHQYWPRTSLTLHAARSSMGISVRGPLSSASALVLLCQGPQEAWSSTHE